MSLPAPPLSTPALAISLLSRMTIRHTAHPPLHTCHMSGRLPSPSCSRRFLPLSFPSPALPRRCIAGNLDEGSKKRGGARSTRKPWAEAEDVQLIASQPVLYTAVAHRAWIAQNSFPWRIAHTSGSGSLWVAPLREKESLTV